MTERQLRWVLLSIPLGALALYIYTAHPAPGWIDSGELAVVSHTLGIPHPTGKPLYVLLSRLSVILVPGSFFPLTFLSGLLVAGGLVFATALVRKTSTPSSLLSAAVAAIILAAAPLVWAQAIINEVHALQFFLMAATLYFWQRRDLPQRPVFVAYTASLAFATHGTAIYLAPLLAESIWAHRAKTKVWLQTLAAAILGLSTYLMLPIRSAQHPLMDWDHTANLSGFWRHVTGWQYSVWTATFDSASLSKALALYGGLLWENLPWAILPLAALGLWDLWQRSRAVLITMLVAALFCMGFGLTYSIPDIAPYYLLSLLIIVIWVAAGVTWLARKKTWCGYVAAAGVVLSVAATSPENFAELNRRDFRVPTNWVLDALDTVEPGGAILSREWDHYSPWLYLRFVCGVRPDVLWIDTELLRRSWYPDFIRQAAPERYARAKPALDRFAPQLALFESGGAYDPAEIESGYARLIQTLSLEQPGPVYVDGVARTPQHWGVERGYLAGAREVPWGILTRLIRPDDTVPPLPAWPTYRNRMAPATTSPRTRMHLELYGRARRARASFQRSP